MIIINKRKVSLNGSLAVDNDDDDLRLKNLH